MQHFKLLHFGNQARCKFESSRYGESSKIQKSSKFEFNPNPYLQPSSRRLWLDLSWTDPPTSQACRCAIASSTTTASAGWSRGFYQRSRVRGLGSAKLANFAKFCKFLAGSFSAVSKRNFARKHAFDSIFQALQDVHTFAPLQSQNFRKKLV